MQSFEITEITVYREVCKLNGDLSPPMRKTRQLRFYHILEVRPTNQVP